MRSSPSTSSPLSPRFQNSQIHTANISLINTELPSGSPPPPPKSLYPIPGPKFLMACSKRKGSLRSRRTSRRGSLAMSAQERVVESAHRFHMKEDSIRNASILLDEEALPSGQPITGTMVLEALECLFTLNPPFFDIDGNRLESAHDALNSMFNQYISKMETDPDSEKKSFCKMKFDEEEIDSLFQRSVSRASISEGKEYSAAEEFTLFNREHETKAGSIRDILSKT